MQGEAYRRGVFSSAMRGVSLEALRQDSRSGTPCNALLCLATPCNAFPALNVQLAKQPDTSGVWVYFMKEISEVYTKFKEWKSEGVKRHFTLKKIPQQNGAMERMNRTLMEHERCKRIHVGLPEAFWAEAVNHTSYLVNWSPSKYLDFNCAEGVWSNKSVEYTNLKVFGWSVYALIPSDERTKLKPKSLECIFLVFESGVKGFKISDPLNQKKILSGDVVFEVKTMPMINPIENVHKMLKSTLRWRKLGNKNKLKKEKKKKKKMLRINSYALSIVLVGTDDGCWEHMKKFQEMIPKRKFDNFQFVNFTEIMPKDGTLSDEEAAFAHAALEKLPSQYKAAVELDLVGQKRRVAGKGKKIVPGSAPVPHTCCANAMPSTCEPSTSASMMIKT
ncbi:unnamed protein product [Prunus armeniaca]